MTNIKTLVTGGARSGKSRYALELASSSTQQKTFIATAEARDGEMKERIEKHKAERSDEWVTVEEPLEVANVISKNNSEKNLLLLDCLALWASNTLELGEKAFKQKSDEFAEAIALFEGTAIIVTSEVGSGIVPADTQTRLYRDRLGFLNQKIAGVCQEVVFMACGIPMYIKGKN